MGVRKIALVEQVFDVELELQPVGRLEECRRIDAGEGRQAGGGRRGADRGELARLVDHAKAKAQFAGGLVAVPQGELVFGHLRQPHGIIAVQPRVLIGIGGAHLPIGRDPPGQGQLHAFGARCPDVDGRGDILGVRRRRVGAVKPEHGQRGVEIGADIPLGADFVIGEPFGGEVLLGRAQGQELVARPRQERLAVAAVERDVLPGLYDQADPRRDLFVGAGEGARRSDQVGALDLEAIIPQTHHQIDMLAKADLILDEGREHLDVGYGVAGQRTKGHGRIDDVGQIERSARQDQVAALVGRCLIGIFDAKQHLVGDCADIDIPDEVGLDDEVLPGGGIGIVVQRHRARLTRGRATGKDVGVELVVIAVEHRGRRGEVFGQLAIEPRLDDMRLEASLVHAGNAEKGIAEAFDRAIGLARSGRDRRDAAIGDALVIDIFIGQPSLPATAEVDRQIGVHGVALALEEVPVVVEALVGGVDPERRILADRGVDVSRHVP